MAVMYHQLQPLQCALQDELEKAGAKLQALQSEMHKLQNDAEELGKQLKSTRNDMQQAQKESQVGHVYLSFLCSSVSSSMPRHVILSLSRKLQNLPMSLHCPSWPESEGTLSCVAA